jgi:3-hydroxybutyryl-CoA dehydrogenase
VHARSTPGFIVNRIARPYYAETLALLQEQAGTPAAIDACLRAAGFRMGPCELMDLIGHDTNFSVTQSVYEANFYDKRYVPSGVQREMVDGGLLGRKSGRGFFDYREGAAKASAAEAVPGTAPVALVVALHGRGPLAERFAAALTLAGVVFQRAAPGDWTGLDVDGAQLRLSDGRTASQLGADVAVFDLPLATTPGAALAWAPSLRASLGWMDTAPRWLQVLGFTPQRLGDAPGLVVARTIAMLINEAADAVQQCVCTAEGADAAMKLGVNYPAGPFEWLARWDTNAVVALLDALDAHYRGERYRVSPWLRQRAWA